MTDHRLCLGLGGNLGDAEQTIHAAYQYIERLVGRIERRSSFVHSPSWGYSSPHPFVNSAILVRTRLRPLAVLACTQYIEFRLGKRPCHATTRPSRATVHSVDKNDTSDGATLGDVVYHDRPIDIDLLLYDDLHIATPRLTLPHPQLLQRPFVTNPLREIGLL